MIVQMLIVDDEPEIREALSRNFRMLGYGVDVAASAEEGLDLLARKRYDIVVSDIVMPGMSGVEFLDEIRSEYPMAHVIMITGYVTQENVLACMRRGADTIIFKPLDDMTELEKAVQRAVEDIRRWQQKLRQLRAMKPSAPEVMA